MQSHLMRAIVQKESDADAARRFALYRDDELLGVLTQ
jgi:hypothetical protein